MTDLNNVALVGRISRDAELKYTQGGSAITKFSIAVNRPKKTGDSWGSEASFFDVTIMGRAAESLHRFLVKGKQIGLQGELRQNRWEQDGHPRSKVEVIAKAVQLLGAKDAPSEAPSDPKGPAPQDFEDDIPF